LPNDCGRASGSLVILEGESLGDIPENARKRDWLPGHCGLLPHLFVALRSAEQDGPLATAGLPVRNREIANGQLALAHAALVARESRSAVELKRSFRRHAVFWQSRKSRTNAVGWLARPHFHFSDSSLWIHLFS
jgi:hypothetical protein